jgi:Magnesium chelatase, subunit ChlI
MLACRLTPMLPTMTQAEALETTRIHRVVGLTGNRTALVTTGPFRAPLHTISDAGLIGGGRPVNMSPSSLGSNPDSTAPVAHIDGLGWPAKAELDASVLQRWRHLFYAHGDESPRRSAHRLTVVGSVLEAYAVRLSR